MERINKILEENDYRYHCKEPGCFFKTKRKVSMKIHKKHRYVMCYSCGYISANEQSILQHIKDLNCVNE